MLGRTCAFAILVATSCAMAGCASARHGQIAGSSHTVSAATRSTSPAVSATVDFLPTATWFVSAQHGWIIGQTQCGNRSCGFVKVTHDGGATWAPLPSPTANFSGLGEVVFTDRVIGWILARDSNNDPAGALYATHDGGMTWSGTGLAAYNLWASASQVWLTTRNGDGFVLYSAPASGGVFTRLARVPGTSLTSVGDDLLAWDGLPKASGNYSLVLVTGTTVSQRHLPCPNAFQVAVAAMTADKYVAVCGGQGSTGIQIKTAYSSVDQGRSWDRLGALPLGGYVGTVAATPATLVLVGPRLSILNSTNGGRSWAVAFAGVGSAGSTSHIRFTSSFLGVALSDRQLVTTADGGRHWTAHQLG